MSDKNDEQYYKSIIAIADANINKHLKIKREAEESLAKIEKDNAVSNRYNVQFDPTAERVKELFVDFAEEFLLNDSNEEYIYSSYYELAELDVTLSGWRITQEDYAEDLDDGPGYDGREVYRILKCEKDGEAIYFRLEGFYSSYDGEEYTEVRKVAPQQKTVTVYE